MTSYIDHKGCISAYICTYMHKCIWRKSRKNINLEWGSAYRKICRRKGKEM